MKLNSLERKNEAAGLKTLTPNKLLSRLPILLAQEKGRNNSCKLKTQIMYLLHQHNKITKTFCSNLIKSL